MKIHHYIAIVFLLVFSVGQLSAATVVFDHSGANDPTTEGWTFETPAGHPTGSVTTGAAGGAWYVNDTSINLYTTGVFQQLVTPEQLVNADFGWELSTTLQMVAPRSTGYYPYTMHVNYQNGTTRWLMYFGIDTNGDQFVRLYTGHEQGIEFTTDGLAYHTYSLVYDPNEGSADLFVDGVERISDYAGFSPSGYASVSWGAGASNATGQANFASVQWKVAAVPVPGTMLLLGAGLIALAGICKRR